jgi:dihydroorotase
MKYLIKNGSIIDPARRVATVGDVLVADGKVVQLFDLAEMHAEREAVGDDVEIINARGCVIAPGFTDLHVHLREPGEEYKETIASGTLAAARGGFTTICAMPDTDPAMDNAAVVRQVRQIARREAHVHIEVIAAISVGRAGQSLSEMQSLVEAGAIAFSDEDRAVENPALMRNALHYASGLGFPVMSHCEDRRLNKGWAMHEGVVSTRLGLPGYPAAAEESMIARDISLAESCGAHLHICHVSTAGGVELIRLAKGRGVRVTAEVTPHHLTLTEQWVLGSLASTPLRDPHADTQPQVRTNRRKRTNHSPELGLPSWLNPTLLPPFDGSTRVNPPLRTEEDVEALIEGLRDGTIDAIATDHTPQALLDKACEYGLAAPGISGLETALGLVLTLVHRGEMDLVNMVAKLTEGPAQVLGRSPATLRPGARADIVIFDPDRLWMVDSSLFASKGKNSPLQNQQLKGQVMLTMAAGRIAFRRDNFGRSQAGPPPQASKLEGILDA